MFTPWTAYAVTVTTHRTELHDEIAAPRRARRHSPARPVSRPFHRHAARPATTGS
jgi:hypothetical protein